METWKIRDATLDDVPEITEIYGYEVVHGTTFELDPPSPDEMARRMRAVIGEGLPYVVADDGARVLGYAYCGLYRPRPAYRFTVEDSVYVARAAHRRGVGRALLMRVLELSEARGMRQVIAVIGDSTNIASVELHRSCGFEYIGTFHAVGWKHGTWQDTVLMQCAVGPGATEPPG